jgi:hypothetical protein
MQLCTLQVVAGGHITTINVQGLTINLHIQTLHTQVVAGGHITTLNRALAPPAITGGWVTQPLSVGNATVLVTFLCVLLWVAP